MWLGQGFSLNLWHSLFSLGGTKGRFWFCWAWKPWGPFWLPLLLFWVPCLFLFLVFCC